MKKVLEPIKTIIIEDEPLAREDLREMLKNHPEIEILWEAGTVCQAGELLKTVSPDLVFLDIQLRGGSGFDLVPKIPRLSHIIFFTSHDRFAIRAFEINALDYLLKPVTEERLSASINRLKQKWKSPERVLCPAEPVVDDADQIYIQTNRERRFVKVAAVVAVISIGGNYTAIHLNGGDRMVLRKTLKQWEGMLQGSQFCRIHRSAIANTNYLRVVEKQRDGKFLAGFDGLESSIEVSRKNVRFLVNLMKKRVQKGAPFRDSAESILP